MTIQERALMFENRFQGKTLSKSLLQRLYKNFKIKLKKIKLSKMLNYRGRRILRDSINTAKDQISFHLAHGFRIIYIDEVLVTKSTIQSKEFNLPYSRTEIPQASLNERTIATIVGVSKERRVDLAMSFNDSVSIPEFKIYIERLRQKCFLEDICIYFDNLSGKYICILF